MRCLFCFRKTFRYAWTLKDIWNGIIYLWVFQQTSLLFVWFFQSFFLQGYFSSPTQSCLLVLVFPFLWAFSGVKNSNPKEKFSGSSSSAGLPVAMFSLIFCWSFPTFFIANCRRTVTRGENFFSKYLFADVISVHNGNMKHATAIEFDYTNLPAML